MTVGVGVVCQRGTCVVMATDTKGSFAGNLFPSHNRLSKQLALPFRLCGSIAGDVDTCNVVENRLFEHLRSYPANLSVSLAHVLGSVEKAKSEEFLRRVNDKMLALFGMTVSEWQHLPSKDSRYRRGARLMKRYVFPVELIVGGLIMGSGVILSFIGMDTVGMGELGCVGSGGDAAYAHLMSRGQNVYMSLPRAILHVGEAMREAKNAEPETVGDPADYVVITEHQTRRMPARHPILQKMLIDYSSTETDSIDSDTDLFEVVQGSLYVDGISKEDYSKGIRAPR